MGKCDKKAVVLRQKVIRNQLIMIVVLAGKFIKFLNGWPSDDYPRKGFLPVLSSPKKRLYCVQPPARPAIE